VIDNNKFGLSLLNNRLSSVPITLEEADILDGSRGQQKKFDVVYSVGLIEHFDPIGTRRAIRAHFERCEVGGVVLITFPTPTVLYKLLRAIAEMIGKWPFHDERPLNFDEVELTCDQHGVILHRSINWLIGFTQGYVVYRKLY
jgi:cyclopropane fatty-acyl-phospholipid synthase-like methyltransferase